VAKKETKKSEKAKNGAAKQTLAMWALLGEGGGALGGILKPEIKKAEREALKQAGLIEVEKKKNGAYWLIATDKGWDWANDHLSDPLPQTKNSSFVLQAWLLRLESFLKSQDLRLSHVFAVPSKKSPQPVPEPDHAELRQRIRSAYHDIAGGFDRRVLLRDLRPKLKDIDRALVDATLMQMLRDEEVSLMQLDYRPDVSGEDHAAALQIGNEPRHLIWIPK
jgi:hypothetical protein